MYSYAPEKRADFHSRVAPQSLVNLLAFNRTNCRFTDPRDYLYAILGHPYARSCKSSSRLVPDYEKPVAQVFQEFATSYLQETEDSNLIGYAGDVSSLTLKKGALPSWCPQWNTYDEYSWPFHSEDERYRYNASKDRKFKFQMAGQNRLIVEGFVFDEVVSTSAQIWPALRNRQLERLMELEPFFHSIKNSAEKWNILTACCQAIYRGHRAVKEPKHRFRDFARFISPLAKHLDWLDPPDLSSLENAAELGDEKRFANDCLSRSIGRVLFSTKHKRICLGSHALLKGDLCCTIFGAKTPLVLRPTEDGAYTFVCEAYIEEVMRGETVDMLDQGKFEQRRFWLL